jgi:hypothetical protein
MWAAPYPHDPYREEHDESTEQTPLHRPGEFVKGGQAEDDRHTEQASNPADDALAPESHGVDHLTATPKKRFPVYFPAMNRSNLAVST